MASATLTVFLNRVTKPGSISLARISGDWDEETIPVVTFTDLPGQIAVIPANAKRAFVRLDLTNLVKGWLDGTFPNDGVAVKAEPSGNVVVIALDSKENSATGHSAQLQLNFVDQPAIVQSFKGAWSGANNYAAGEIVSFGGSTWVAVTSGTNLQPDTNPSAWTLFAQQGIQGQKGDKGDMGATGATGTQLNLRKLALLKWDAFTVNNRHTVGTSPIYPCFDGQNIWATNYEQNTVTKINALNGETIGTYSTGAYPRGICYDGKNVWVSHYGDSNNGLTKFDARTGANLGTFATGVKGGEMCFDGENLWFANDGPSTLTKVNASTGSVIGTYPCGTHPYAVCFDGDYIWVANGGSASVTRLDKLTGAILATYSTGATPTGICFDGANIWVANRDSNTVTKFAASTGAFIGTYNVANGPNGICFDGRHVWVAHLFAPSSRN